MITDIRIVEIPDEFGGNVYQIAKFTYDDEGYLTDVDTIEQFETNEALLRFTDQVYKASLRANVLYNPKDGTYEL